MPPTAAERVLPRAPSRVDSVPSRHLHATHVVHNGRVSQPVTFAVCAVCAAPLHSMRCGVPLIVTGVAKLGTRARTFVHHSACARACFARAQWLPLSRGRGLEPARWSIARDLSGASCVPGNRTWRAAVQSANTQTLPCHGPNPARDLVVVVARDFAPRDFTPT